MFSASICVCGTDPGSNAIAMPVGAALNYYETLGQNWSAPR